MMSVKRILLLALFFFSINLFVPKTSHAIDLKEVLTSDNSVVVKIQEGIEYFLAFRVENKVTVLEKHAEKRLVMAQSYAEEGNDEKVQDALQSYTQIKEKQNNLLGKINSGEVLGMVEERTIEQQKTMEEIKTKINEDGKQNVIQVQERVVNQVAQRVVETNGTEGQTKFLNEVLHVWAPGTGPGGGEAGVVYEGGGKLIYAQGTGPGEGRVVIEGGEMKFATGASMDQPEADTKSVEVKTGGGDSGGTNTVEGGNAGTTSDSNQNADPGTDDTRTWIDP